MTHRIEHKEERQSARNMLDAIDLYARSAFQEQAGN
jgi:hypothetical protein